jgi:predicted alpha/beta hydrolase family esterase
MEIPLRMRQIRTRHAAEESHKDSNVRFHPLVIAARDDGYGTFASAEYTASRIAGAKFLGFDQGGHILVGHDDEVMAAIVSLLIPVDGPPQP